MNKRGTGVIFCLISSLLFIARYIAASIFGSSLSSWSSKLFNAMLEYVGPELHYASLVSLIVGIIYLVWAELEERR